MSVLRADWKAGLHECISCGHKSDWTEFCGESDVFPVAKKVSSYPPPPVPQLVASAKRRR